MLSRATLKNDDTSLCIEFRKSFRQQKRPRPRLESRPGSRNFVRLLAVQFTRARFTGPLPPKEEAVRKSEVSISNAHSAV
jgi:hypothetical protein